MARGPQARGTPAATALPFRPDGRTHPDPVDRLVDAHFERRSGGTSPASGLDRGAVGEMTADGVPGMPVEPVIFTRDGQKDAARGLGHAQLPRLRAGRQPCVGLLRRFARGGRRRGAPSSRGAVLSRTGQSGATKGLWKSP